MKRISSCVILLLLLLSICLCNLSPEFSNKSLYVSSLKRTPSSGTPNNEELLLQKSYETDMLIVKYEKSTPPSTHSTADSFSLFVNSLYYQSVICLDSSNTNTFYTLKNKVLKHLSTFHYKNSDSYAEVVNGKHYCLEREEYIGKHIGLNEKNSLLDRNYFYNLVNTGDMSKAKAPLIEQMTNVSFLLIQQTIREEFSKLIQNWNDDCSYELYFTYDAAKELFILTQVFVYFLPKTPQSPELLPFALKSFAKTDEFNEVIINDQVKREIIKFNKKYEAMEAKAIPQMTYPWNKLFKLKTNKSTSVFHNTMEIQLSDEIVEDYYKQFSISSKKDRLCYLIHEILTEDTYIEKNEFKHFVNQYISFPYELSASAFIEQELSSDLSQQAYFTFYFCATADEIKSLNYTIAFPIHFRYQPSVKADSPLTHQTVVLPAPMIFVHPDEFYDPLVFSRLLYALNIYEKPSFERQIEVKANMIISKYQLLANNYETLLHQIPAGQMKYFDVIAKVTSLASIIGFAVIMFGLFKYITAKKSTQKTTKQE